MRDADQYPHPTKRPVPLAVRDAAARLKQAGPLPTGPQAQADVAVLQAWYCTHGGPGLREVIAWVAFMIADYGLEPASTP